MERHLRILANMQAHLVVNGIMFATLLGFGVGLNLVVQSADPASPTYPSCA